METWEKQEREGPDRGTHCWAGRPVYMSNWKGRHNLIIASASVQLFFLPWVIPCEKEKCLHPGCHAKQQCRLLWCALCTSALMRPLLSQLSRKKGVSNFILYSLAKQKFAFDLFLMRSVEPANKQEWQTQRRNRKTMKQTLLDWLDAMRGWNQLSHPFHILSIYISTWSVLPIEQLLQCSERAAAAAVSIHLHIER